MAKLKKKPEAPKGAPEWMNTYGDMVTLLLCFFILLFSFSSVDAEKWKKVVESFSGVNTNIMPGSNKVIDGGNIQPIATNKVTTPSSPGTTNNPDNDSLNSLYKGIIEYIKNSGNQINIEATKTDNEIRIRFLNNVLFDTGKALLRPDSEIILNELTSVIKSEISTFDLLRIEGHTDSRPILGGPYKDNLELSGERAMCVLRYLINSAHMDAAKMCAVGYGEYQPIAKNDSNENLAKNRRVELVVSKNAIFRTPIANN